MIGSEARLTWTVATPAASAHGAAEVHVGPDRPLGQDGPWIPTVPRGALVGHLPRARPDQGGFDRAWALEAITPRG